MNLVPKVVHKTLSLRISLMLVFAMGILLLAALVVMLHFSRKSVKEEALQKASQTLEGTVQHIDNILLSVEQSTGNLYYNIFSRLDSTEDMTVYCQELVESNPYIDGCAIAFRSVCYESNKHFMDFYTERKWFKTPMTTGAATWQTPIKGTINEGDPAITFSLPLTKNNGELIGIIGVDMSLSRLSRVVLDAKPSPNSYCTLLADDGSFIVHPDSAKLNYQTIFEQNGRGTTPTMKKAAESMISGETGYMPFTMNGKDYYVFFKPFKRMSMRGRTVDNLKWSVGIIYPEEDIFGDYNLLLYYVLAIAIISLLLFFMLCRTITHRLLLPLRMLTNSAQEIAAGKYDLTIPNTRRQDEIGQLQDNFGQMQQSLAANVHELEEMKATLEKHNKSLHAAYDKARKASRMKTAFLHNMTDQMIPPAKAIASDVKALSHFDKNMGMERVGRLADDIQQQGETITDLLNGLLRISEEGKEKEVSYD